MAPRVYAIGCADRTCTLGGTANLSAALRSGRALRRSAKARHSPCPLARREGPAHSSPRPHRRARRQRKSWLCEVYRGVECAVLTLGGVRGRSGAQPTDQS